MYLLFGIAHDIFPTFFADVQSMTVSDIIPLCCQLVVATFVFAGALKTLPQFASGIVAGSPLGGGIQAGSGAALAGAVAGGGAIPCRHLPLGGQKVLHPFPVPETGPGQGASLPVPAPELLQQRAAVVLVLDSLVLAEVSHKQKLTPQPATISLKIT